MSCHAAAALAAMEPMEFAAARAPFDDLAWGFELKYDGLRVLACTGVGARLKAPGGSDATCWFKEVARSLEDLHGDCIVDGEMVVLDDLGRSSGRGNQWRVRARGGRDVSQRVVYRVFDMLMEDGHDIRASPFLARKLALINLLRRPLPYLVYVEHVVGEGRWLFEQVLNRQLVGMAAKRLDSSYRSGRRSRDWLAIRPSRASRLAGQTR